MTQNELVTQRTDHMPDNDELYRKAMLDTLEYLHNFCEANHLRYYLIGGGLIGAIRNHGFIPWDNDLDVAMPREDHDRLCKLRDQITGPFRISIPGDEDGYPNTKIRIFKTTPAVAEPHMVRYVFGPWVDIFPLDNTFDNRLLRWLHFRAVYVAKVLTACRLGGINVTHPVKGRVKYAIHVLMLIFPKRYILYLYHRLVTIKSRSGRLVGNIMGKWREREIIPRIELDNRHLYPFENITVYSFSNYDAWLRNVYGAYMTPPPPAAQQTDHPIHYV